MAHHRLIVLGVVVVIVVATGAPAAPCPVPTGSHPTIQDAVDDLACTDIVLGAQVYPESASVDRSLAITGAGPASTTIAGRLAINGGGVVVSVTEVTVDASHPSVAGCFGQAIDVGGGARMTGTNVVGINGGGDACLIFGDGFEDGTTGAWFITVP